MMVWWGLLAQIGIWNNNVNENGNFLEEIQNTIMLHLNILIITYIVIMIEN